MKPYLTNDVRIPDQGEKRVPNTFIMFVCLFVLFSFTGLIPVQIHTPNLFSSTWGWLNIY